MPPTIPDLIPCYTQAELDKELKDARETLEQPETEHSWERLARCLTRLASITRGGAYKMTSQYIDGMKGLSRAIINSMLSERTRLSGTAVELLLVMAQHLEERFEPLLNLYIPHVLKLCSRTNKMYVSRGQEVIFCVISSTHRVSLIPHLRESVKDKSQTLRIVATEAAFRCLNECDPVQLESKVGDIEQILKISGRDPHPEVRQTARKIFSAYSILFPGRLNDFIGPLTPVIKKYLDIKPSGAQVNGPQLKQPPEPHKEVRPTAKAPGPSKKLVPKVEFPLKGNVPVASISTSALVREKPANPEVGHKKSASSSAIHYESSHTSSSRPQAPARPNSTHTIKTERPRAIRPERVEGGCSRSETQNHVAPSTAAVLRLLSSDVPPSVPRRAQRPVRPISVNKQVGGDTVEPVLVPETPLVSVPSTSTVVFEFPRQRTTSVSSVATSIIRPASSLSNGRPPSAASSKQPLTDIQLPSSSHTITSSSARARAALTGPPRKASPPPNKIKTSQSSKDVPGATTDPGRPASHTGTTAPTLTGTRIGSTAAVTTRPESRASSRTRVLSNASVQSMPSSKVRSLAQPMAGVLSGGSQTVISANSRPPVTTSTRPPVARRFVLPPEAGFVPKRTQKASLTQPTLSVLAKVKAIQEEKAAAEIKSNKPIWGGRIKAAVKKEIKQEKQPGQDLQRSVERFAQELQPHPLCSTAGPSMEPLMVPLPSSPDRELFPPTQGPLPPSPVSVTFPNSFNHQAPHEVVQVTTDRQPTVTVASLPFPELLQSKQDIISLTEDRTTDTVPFPPFSEPSSDDDEMRGIEFGPISTSIDDNPTLKDLRIAKVLADRVINLP